MKVISLWAPWSGWVIDGHKPIETRLHSKFGSLVGKRIAIHATAFPGRKEWGNRFRPACRSAKIFGGLSHKEGLSHRDFTFGAILGFANVVEHRQLTGADSKGGLIDCENFLRFGLFLENVFKLEKPIHVKGRQGIWNWEPPEGIKCQPDD